MMGILLFGSLISFLTALIGVLLALRIQYRILAEKNIEREAWEHAQESHQLSWETRQKKHTLEIEQLLTWQTQEIHDEWADWETRNNSHASKLRLEYTINALQKVEETPLSLDGHHHVFQAPANWQAPSFYQADLRERDFSHCYLGQADFRDAQLAGAIFYMADLRDACLCGANLAGASLIGANLTGADLRGANLSGANLLVADLRHAILNNANLQNVRNLTTQQIYEATYDHTTQLDPEVDITMARIPATPVKTISPPHTDELIQQNLEAPLLSPQASDDNQQDPLIVDLPADRPENTHTGVFDTAIPRIGRNGKKRAMAG
ncbi:MAG TPA: pentapeptide repeat-containing protein [Ktedonobacteraceae bacterium]|nr:pentapeptide repeat-containing protein [Ktedonobacteraceae bacterium]